MFDDEEPSYDFRYGGTRVGFGGVNKVRKISDGKKSAEKERRNASAERERG